LIDCLITKYKKIQKRHACLFLKMLFRDFKKIRFFCHSCIPALVAELIPQIPKIAGDKFQYPDIAAAICKSVMVR